jgi:tetratricopeptide (TPR) repeat protein
MDSKLDWYDFWNYFYLGNYQAALQASSQELEHQQWPREVFLAMVRIRLALRDWDGVRSLQAQCTDAWIVSLINTLLRIGSFAVSPDKWEAVRATVTGDTSALEAAHQADRLFAASALSKAGLYTAALETIPLDRCASDAECRACRIILWLQLNRLDRAQLEFQAFDAWSEQQLLDGDHAAIGTLVQLTKAALVLASDSVEDTEIEHILTDCKELAERYGRTAKLLNLMYCCSLRLGREEAAEKFLQAALALDPTDADTLANAVTHLAAEWMMTAACPGSAESVNQFQERLQAQSPWHPWLYGRAAFEEALSNCFEQEDLSQGAATH